MRIALITALVLLGASSGRADDAEDAAVELVNKLGGSVKRDADAVVTEVILSDTAVGAAGLKAVARLKGLKTLELNRTQVTDEDISLLRGCANLTNLDLNWTKVTDAGLKDIAALPRLTRLALTGTKVTD